jgi:hypothetical protein
MPFIGVGIHVLIALYFAVHAVRSGQQMYWLFVLFSFPLLGSVVYFLAIYMPSSRLEHGARRVVAAAARTLDPGRELREARAAFEYTPTAQNQMRLAQAQLEAGAASDAAATYDACLSGAFGNDLEIRRGAARANLASGRVAEAIAHLEFIARTDPAFRAEEVALLRAQALGASGRKDEAKAAFEDALKRFGSFNVRAEYAIWAMSVGDTGMATMLRPELDRVMQRWSRHNRELNADMIRRLKSAYATSTER